MKKKALSEKPAGFHEVKLGSMPFARAIEIIEFMCSEDILSRASCPMVLGFQNTNISLADRWEITKDAFRSLSSLPRLGHIEPEYGGVFWFANEDDAMLIRIKFA